MLYYTTWSNIARMPDLDPGDVAGGLGLQLPRQLAVGLVQRRDQPPQLERVRVGGAGVHPLSSAAASPANTDTRSGMPSVEHAPADLEIGFIV